MPLTDAPNFSLRQDLHILRGDRPTLLWKLLDVTFDSGTPNPGSGTFEAYRAQHNDVVIQLRPVFDFDEVGTKFAFSNIEIDQSTGALSALKPAPPEPAAHNFIIEARVTTNGTAAVPKWAPARLRVHVHQRVERIWMTPSRLSIHRPTPAGDCNTNYRFTVRAEFDDGVVADITSTTHYRPDPSDAECFFDSGTEPCFVRLPAALGPGSVRTLSVVTTPAWNTRSAHADIAVLEPWATAPIPNAVLVDGHPDVWDGTLKPEKVPNIVFLASGLRPLDMAAFETMTNDIVHKMKTSRHLAPYNHLASSMNYWRIFMPGTDAGVSVRCEVYSVVDADGQRFALPVPAPAPPPDTGVQPLNPKLTLGHLIYLFGLPIPSDLTLVLENSTHHPPADFEGFNKLDPADIDFSPLLEKWRLTKPPLPMLDVPTIAPKLLKEWVSLANRTFIDEIDSFPPLAIGEPPSVEFDSSGPITFYGLGRGGIWFENLGPERTPFFRRVSAEPRNGVTTTLDDTGGQASELGNLWVEDRTGFTFDNRPFVVAIPNMAIGNSFRFFGRSQWRAGEGLLLRPTMRQVDPPRELIGVPVKSADGRHALVLDTPPWSSLTFLPETRDVLAHELGHAFGLGDEYTEPVPVPFGFEHVPFANLMRSDAGLDGNRAVMFGSLKWNWQRIRKASVLTRPVDDRANGKFHVFLAKGAGNQFATGDSVRLRQRDPKGTLDVSPVTSIVEFVVESIHPDNIDDPNDKLNMTMVLKNESIGIDVSPFGAGSIVYLPIPFPAGGFARPYLTLVSPAAERIMTAIGGTMSGKACDTSDMKRFRARVQLPTLSWDELEAHVPMRIWTTIVGAYYGGAQDACGVLHPAGSCFMRTGVDGFTVFCAACRFALVDRIDPEQHWRNDLEYEGDYFL